ncbi:hypothetical protein [Haloarcula onubensis]|uniref:DUF1772 domain-containing protein n=1 Tax=Haloarcula onubensis TaxID=2950539 RepID=A0ABU2FMH7_9EURY|nr:hypothetical protein [Halomicroarcula sp. S3CR25-11]MDS0281964.1 hypothetical protein [Halomicroarcula sp. S3CR25-11]
MPLGGLAVSTGIMLVGAGVFVLGYPEQLVDVWVDGSDSEDRPAGITARRWVQLRGALAAAVGVALIVVGFASMF